MVQERKRAEHHGQGECLNGRDVPKTGTTHRRRSLRGSTLRREESAQLRIEDSATDQTWVAAGWLTAV